MGLLAPYFRLPAEDNRHGRLRSYCWRLHGDLSRFCAGNDAESVCLKQGRLNFYNGIIWFECLESRLYHFQVQTTLSLRNVFWHKSEILQSDLGPSKQFNRPVSKRLQQLVFGRKWLSPLQICRSDSRRLLAEIWRLFRRAEELPRKGSANRRRMDILRGRVRVRQIHPKRDQSRLWQRRALAISCDAIQAHLRHGMVRLALDSDGTFWSHAWRVCRRSLYRQVRT